MWGVVRACICTRARACMPGNEMGGRRGSPVDGGLDVLWTLPASPHWRPRSCRLSSCKPTASHPRTQVGSTVEFEAVPPARQPWVACAVDCSASAAALSEPSPAPGRAGWRQPDSPPRRALVPRCDSFARLTTCSDPLELFIEQACELEILAEQVCVWVWVLGGEGDMGTPDQVLLFLGRCMPRTAKIG